MYGLFTVYGSSADLNVTVDDGENPIYNGDENHKVWNGSQDQLDAIAMESPYEVFSGNTSTLGRPVRARQISTPIDVPPPPMREENSKKRKGKKLSKTPGTQSLSGTLIRPKPIHPSTLQRPGLYGGLSGSVIYGSAVGSGGFPPPHGSRNYHTISHRSFHGGPPGSQPHFHHPGMPPPHPPQMMHKPQMGIPMQMPVMMSQYATLQSSRSTKKKKKDKKSSGIPVGLPMIPPIYTYHQGMGPPPPPQPTIAQSLIGEPRSLAMSNRKLAVSMGNGLDDGLNSGTESPGGTGIYRRKGHLNERAFSYSIRQEHRSRSHGSLASLKFNPPDMKKEREIAQMVAGLDLNDGPEGEMSSTTLQRKHMIATNDGGIGIQSQQAIYGNGGANALYGNSMCTAGSFGKPRR